MSNLKICYKCNIEKELDLFPFRKDINRYRNECKSCKAKYLSKYNKANKERARYLNNNWVSNNRDLVNKRSRERYHQNKEKKQISNKKWAEINRQYAIILSKEWYKKNRDKKLADNKEWYKNNPLFIREKQAKRRAQKNKAMPIWVDRKEIKKIYKGCPVGYHVDHIIPLNHPLICGLHVPWNLQYLTAKDNLKKSNSVEGLNV